jgi:hypothetical protein
MLLFFLGLGGIKASSCLPLGALFITNSVSVDELSFASVDVFKTGIIKVIEFSIGCSNADNGSLLCKLSSDLIDDTSSALFVIRKSVILDLMLACIGLVVLPIV